VSFLQNFSELNKAFEALPLAVSVSSSPLLSSRLVSFSSPPCRGAERAADLSRERAADGGQRRCPGSRRRPTTRRSRRVTRPSRSTPRSALRPPLSTRPHPLGDSRVIGSVPCGVANRADSFATLACPVPVQAGWMRARASTAPARWPIRPPPTRRWCCAAAGTTPLPVCVRRARCCYCAMVSEAW